MLPKPILERDSSIFSMVHIYRLLKVNRKKGAKYGESDWKIFLEVIYTYKTEELQTTKRKMYCTFFKLCLLTCVQNISAKEIGNVSNYYKVLHLIKIDVGPWQVWLRNWATSMHAEKGHWFHSWSGNMPSREYVGGSQLKLLFVSLFLFLSL